MQKPPLVQTVFFLAAHLFMGFAIWNSITHPEEAFQNTIYWIVAALLGVGYYLCEGFLGRDGEDRE